LRLELEHFVQCVRDGQTPRSDGHSGLRVVRVLERLQHSLDR
jgi:UDP-2-acetamido-3-amino-2,3-dideoxy-glucuronate N-acetyltransferase